MASEAERLMSDIVLVTGYELQIKPGPVQESYIIEVWTSDGLFHTEKNRRFDIALFRAWSLLCG